MDTEQNEAPAKNRYVAALIIVAVGAVLAGVATLGWEMQKSADEESSISSVG
ncbi:hypothetical protein [Salininema proteolyticum]|uniref:Uncharacterized protein n=1 Tax=Salininema proteolyticum TaxID=1607685 RepID=A0ABV8TZA9_9ACTN